jgi:hypothetical protein
LDSAVETPRVSATRDRWEAWPVYWSAVWVGALGALAVGLIIGLIAIAVGASEFGPGHQLVSWHKYGFGALFFSVGGAFASFAAGGWLAGKIAGIRRAETAMLHGAIVWLIALPLLVLLAALGAGSFFGGWYGGLAGTPGWVSPAAAAADPNAAAIARNEALGAVAGILIGLVGAVIGGWLASGEEMSIRRNRVRTVTTRSTAGGRRETIVATTPVR